jgi:phosphoribosylglycinamide formyltransferase-1
MPRSKVFASTATGLMSAFSLYRSYKSWDRRCTYNSTINVAAFCSTRGSSLQPIIDAIESKRLNANVYFVLSNKAEAPALERAKRHNIPTVALHEKNADGSKKTRTAFDAETSDILKQHPLERILFIGYMRKTTPEWVDQWGHITWNVHPSLLPKFTGLMDLEVHKAVIKAGEKESGCTIHLVTKDVDAGPIVVQKKCPVFATDTPEDLKARVQKLEGEAYIEALDILSLKKRLEFEENERNQVRSCPFLG